MTKMIARRRRCNRSSAANSTSTPPSTPTCPSSASCRCSTGSTATRLACDPPASRATVRQLVTHTAGLGYWFWDADLMRYEQVTGTPNVVPGSAEALQGAAAARPRRRASSYGINIDWLGRVVEAVAGTTLDVVVKDNITGPLGMGDTMFRLDDQRSDNCVTVHVPGEDGTWVSAGAILNPDPEWWAGGHGLYSTPRDYIRFERALLRGGELDGERILTQKPRSTPRSPTRSVSWTSRRRSRPPTRRSATTFNVGPGLEVGLRPAPEHRGHPGRAPGRHRRLGGPVQHPLLRRPHQRDLRVDLHQLAAVRQAEGRGRPTATSRRRSTRRCENAVGQESSPARRAVDTASARLVAPSLA